ncbi:hypothetical protein TNCV_4373551 [Trichonephila clavipes]|uniref:Uncharacterized protein n=1 Tax=Trichonephila clavipes TaxID=2585209 RepID=A0A8X6R4B2_TRICX|nr:hypothetical protein TNCV_4373551 [Trichonephila clavipes]
MREKGGNHLVPGLDYMVDALKLPNHAPRVSGELLQTCVASPTKYTKDPSCKLVLVQPPFELLHRTLTTIVLRNIVVCDPFTQSPFA